MFDLILLASLVFVFAYMVLGLGSDCSVVLLVGLLVGGVARGLVNLVRRYLIFLRGVRAVRTIKAQLQEK